MIAFHGNLQIKQNVIDQVNYHHWNNELKRGHYFRKNLDGAICGVCAVGAAIHSDNHEFYPSLLGVPIELAFVQECLFESLEDISEAKDFAVEFWEVINTGSDLSNVYLELMEFLLFDPIYGKYANESLRTDASHQLIGLISNKREGKLCRDTVRIYTQKQSSTSGIELYYAACSLASPDHAFTFISCIKQISKSSIKNKLLQLLRAAPIPETTPA